MDSGFNKIKKQYLRKAIILSVVLGVFGGVLVAGIVLLILKFCQININWSFYLVVGIIAALLCGGIIFLIAKPNDKKLAKKLDKDYNLNERVQTMVEYGDKEGDIVSLQREDTANILNNVPKKKISLANICKLAVMPVLAVTIFFTAVFIPVEGEQDLNFGFDPPFDNTPTDTYKFSQWQKTSLAKLIEDVKGSELEQSLNQGIVLILQNLSQTLEDVTTTELMRATVTTTISLVEGSIDSVNTYSAIYTELNKYSALKALATTVNESVLVYKSSTKFSTIELVNSRAEELDDLITESLSANIAKVEEKHSAYTSVSELKAFVKDSYLNNTTRVINSLKKADEKYLTDDIYVALSDLNQIFSGFETLYGYTLAGLKSYLNEKFEKFTSDITDSVYTQSYNLIMKKFIRQVLSDIFELGLQDNDTSDDSTDDLGDGNTSGGGYGTGDTHYGDDDMEIYYPDENARVKYGEVLGEYYEKVTALVASGDAPEELQRYISEFFGILFSGFSEEDNSQSN